MLGGQQVDGYALDEDDVLDSLWSRDRKSVV